MAVKTKKAAAPKAPKAGKKGETKFQGLVFGKPVAADKLKYRAMPKRGTQYKALFNALAEMKGGQSIVVALGEGEESKDLFNRITSAMTRHADVCKAPDGHRFARRTTEDGGVAIICEKTEKAAPAAK